MAPHHFYDRIDIEAMVLSYELSISMEIASDYLIVLLHCTLGSRLLRRRLFSGDSKCFCYAATVPYYSHFCYFTDYTFLIFVTRLRS